MGILSTVFLVLLVMSVYGAGALALHFVGKRMGNARTKPVISLAIGCLLAYLIHRHKPLSLESAVIAVVALDMISFVFLLGKKTVSIILYILITSVTITAIFLRVIP